VGREFPALKCRVGRTNRETDLRFEQVNSAPAASRGFYLAMHRQSKLSFVDISCKILGLAGVGNSPNIKRQFQENSVVR
jgi:hypothetical protein